MPYLLGEEEVEAVRDVVLSGKLDRYIDGDESKTADFERRFATKLKSKYVLAVSSGTAALICGLAGMGIGPGDEVIIPSFTYIATALAVLAVGAIPVIAEIDDSLTIDPLDIKKKITERTKAIIPVHVQGLPCNMNAIVCLAKKHGLLILEDVAQACGGSYNGKLLGSIGDAGGFSFNHHKIITCGEGGAIVTNNVELYHRALIQHHGGYIYEAGSLHPNVRPFAGSNFRLSEISGAILICQLRKLDFILSKLRYEKSSIRKKLRNIHSDKFRLSPIHDEKGDCCTSVFFLFNTRQQARLFVRQASRRNIKAWFPATKGHIYKDWEPILQKCGVHHPRKDRFNFRDLNKTDNLNCPQTLSILPRTVGIHTMVDRHKPELDKLMDDLIDLLHN